MQTIVIFIFFPVLLLSNHLSYLRLPFTRQENLTHSVHNIQLQVNEYLYRFDINFRGERDYFLNLEEKKLSPNKTNTQDLRRASDMIYGIIEFTGVREADPKLPFFSKTKQNAQFYLRDLLPQQSWFYLNQVIQLSSDENPDKMTQGTINLAFVTFSPFFSNLQHYNSYMKDSLVSFRLFDDNKNGEIFLGTFPTNELVNQKDFAEVKVNNDHQKNWKINIENIQLKMSEKEKIEIFNVPVQFKLSTSDNTLQIPKKACQNLAKVLKSCSMKPINGEKLLVCSNNVVKQDSITLVEIHFYKTFLPLELKLIDLKRETQKDETIFNIKEGEQADYHLSSLMLKDYLIGLDFKKGLFFFGKKKSESLLTRNLLFKLFLYGNAISFLLSLIILTLGSKCKLSTDKGYHDHKLKEEVVYKASKASGYEMAVLTEDIPLESQE